ncbi:hypothetical protein CVD28_21605 [Bacillus sp. M6-12]|uniref:hypothetical protein n=1 Tax=Bacillus sp. M6-12 TaxID=2054166 RepID=UPI000C7610F1|nr:hypothetical protein [Bacillus sp. M6-12]PLS15614.1 hypothetical protein CVD28_21605 [Bacillus sp. M6-12]
MTAFIGLLKKDWQLGKRNLFFVILLQLFIAGGGYALSRYFEIDELMLVAGVVLIFSHLFGLPAILLTLLNIEGKTQLWLYNPNPASFLLGAKILISTVMYIISVAMACTLGYLLITNTSFFEHGNLPADTPYIIDLSLIAIGLTYQSLLMALFLLFFWTFYHSMKFIKAFRWLLIIIIFSGYSWLEIWIGELEIIQELKKTGLVRLSITNYLEMESNGLKVYTKPIDFSIWTVGTSLLMVAIIFLISCKLLDRKVEV